MHQVSAPSRGCTIKGGEEYVGENKMFGRTRPAAGLAWNPGLSEVPGGECRSHHRLSLKRRRYVGHRNASCGAGGVPRVVRDTGQGWVPRHRCALGKWRRGRESRGVPWWRCSEMDVRHDPRPSGRWASFGLRQRQKTTAGAARPDVGGRALIDECEGSLDGGAA